MPARLQFEFHPAPSARRSPHGRLRMLLMGDFSGRAAADRQPLDARPIHRVDIDNFDAVLARVAPTLTIGPNVIEFGELEHFHPDSLYARLPTFAALRQMRQRLADPARFAQAAAELGTAPAPAAGSPAGSGGDLLAGLLGGRPAGATPAPPAGTAASGIDAFIRRAIAPHVVPDTRAQQAALVASVDAAIAAEMRSLLHERAFQALESAWRGAMWLVSTLELGEDLQLHLLDVTRDELLGDVVGSGGRLAETGLHRVLADRWRNVPDGEPWHLLVGLYRFGPADTDIGLAAALGIIASQAGGPLLADGDAALAAADPAALDAWQALRGSEAAPWLGLLAPRVLLRRPYGERSDPLSTFAFEEFPGGAPVPESLLWGSAALAGALLIGRAFGARGWQMAPDDEREIGDLPAYAFRRDGEPVLQPGTESLLGEREGQAWLAAGLMPLLAHRQRNALTLLRWQSIALPPRPLAGLAAASR